MNWLRSSGGAGLRGVRRATRSLARALVPSSVATQRVRTRERCVYLTFDDGAHPENTPRILETLKAYQAQATFFVVGKAALASPELVRRTLEFGHTLGSHTQNHKDLLHVSREELAREIELGRRALMDVGGGATSYFRPPYGRYGLRVVQEVRRQGLQMVLWSLDSLDWRVRDPGDIARFFREKRLRPGEVILLHDDYIHTAQALPAILEHLCQQGWSCRALPPASSGRALEVSVATVP